MLEQNLAVRLSQAFGMHQRGLLAEARDMYEQVIRLSPDNFDALHLLGVVDMQQGHIVSGLALIQKAVDIRPNDAFALNNLANAYRENKQYQQAIHYYRMCLTYAPDYPDAQFSLANLLRESGDNSGALSVLDALLSAHPAMVKALLLQGELLTQSGLALQALASFDQAIAVNSGNAEAWNGRGNVLAELNRHQEAIDCFKYAIAIKPDYAQPYNNLATVYHDMRDYEQSLRYCGQALLITPKLAETFNNQGNALWNLQQFHAAIDSYKQAIAITQDHASAHRNLAVRLLELGRFAEGWVEYEWRWQEHQLESSKREFTEPRWQPDRQDDVVLVWGEQGLGDHILYLSMLNDLIKQVKQVIVATEPRLVSLFQRSFPQATCIAFDDIKHTRFDSQIPMASLGQYLRPDWSSFPQDKPAYLKADPQQAKLLRDKLHTPGKITCGLSWISKNDKVGQDKSLSLEALTPILQLPHLQCIDLQYGDTTEERQQYKAQHGIEITKLTEIDTYQDIDGLASLIDACDIILTISNTTAHIAAALGKPVYLMLPTASGLLWYWHRDRADSPWYPDVHIFRQEKPGRWEPVISDVLKDFNP